jgi:LuxR family maltose regulon positive regulatory protein
LGEVLYERNDLAGAAQALTYGTDLLRGSIEQYLLAQGYVALGRVQQAQGDLEGALAAIQRGEDWFTQMQVTATRAGALLALGKARLWLEQGQLAAASHWAQRGQWRIEETGLSYVQRLTLARLRLAQNQREPQEQYLAEASQILNQLLATAEANGWVSYVIEIMVLQALVCQAQSDPTGALASLERALTLAEPEGYVRLFVDEGAPLAALLRQAQARGIKPGYVDKLLLAFRDSASEELDPGIEARQASPLPPRPATPSLLEPLTERELELLRLVAAGRSNQEVAQELFLAVGTVKKHLNNIFGKLNVSSRTQAIVRARELELL